jgi:hypothetical protein
MSRLACLAGLLVLVSMTVGCTSLPSPSEHAAGPAYVRFDSQNNDNSGQRTVVNGWVVSDARQRSAACACSAPKSGRPCNCPSQIATTNPTAKSEKDDRPVFAVDQLAQPEGMQPIQPRLPQQSRADAAQKPLPDLAVPRPPVELPPVDGPPGPRPTTTVNKLLPPLPTWLSPKSNTPYGKIVYSPG